MKHFPFALLALSLLLFSTSCKNSPETTDEAGNQEIAATDTGTPGVPSADAKTLDEKIQVDLIEGRGLSYQYNPTFEEAMVLVKQMKSSWRTMDEGNQQKVKNIHEDIMKFTTPFELHRFSTDNLDSLSVHLLAGKIKTADAKKEYETIKAKMLEEGKKLPDAKARLDIPALTARFEGIAKAANTKAAGGR